MFRPFLLNILGQPDALFLGETNQLVHPQTYLARDVKKFLSKLLPIHGLVRPGRLFLTRLAFGCRGHQIQRRGKPRPEKHQRKKHFSTHRLFSPAENIHSFPLFLMDINLVS